MFKDMLVTNVATSSNCGNTLMLVLPSYSGNIMMALIMTEGMVKTYKIYG